MTPNGIVNSYCLRFHDKETFLRFKEAFAMCQFETLNQISWSKIKVCVTWFSSQRELTWGIVAG